MQQVLPLPHGQRRARGKRLPLAGVIDREPDIEGAEPSTRGTDD